MVDIERGNGEWGMGNGEFCEIGGPPDVPQFLKIHQIHQLNFKIPGLIPRQSIYPRPMKMLGEWGIRNGT